MELDRRATLGGIVASSLAVSGYLPRPAGARDRRSPQLDRQVDAHCHIFNIRDVPAAQFVLTVAQDKHSIGPGEQALALLIIAMIVDVAPDFAEEQAVLTGILAKRVNPDRVPRNSANPQKLFDRGLRRYIARYTSASPTEDATIDRRANDAFLRDDLIGRFVKDPGHPLVIAAQRPERLTDQAPAIYAAMQAATGQGDQDADDLFQILFVWAPLLADYRFQIAADLGQMFGDSAPGQQLLTPATLDIAAWLPADTTGAPPPTPLLDQAELMRLIALVQPPTRAVHGLIGFDPFHQIAPPPGTPAALDIVKTAIRDKGLIGVKLYPPMGFRATGNAALADSEFPAWLTAGHSGFGGLLDAALDQLYAWCASEAVPIMAHCAATQGAGAGYACRADPAFWGDVLKRHPTLKLNLGHFGGIWGFDGHAPTPGECGTADWTTPIALLMEQYPGVHADVGDFDNILGRPWDRNTAAVLANLQALVKAHPVVAERLMYGTDWQLLDREPQNQLYYAKMRDAMTTTLGDAFLPGFFRDNAVRFFGLAPGGATHRRLSDFYARHQRRSWVIGGATWR